MLVIKDCTVWFLLIGIIAAIGVFAFANWWSDREAKIFGDKILHPLENSFFKDKGYWVGDVTELYRLGKISGELAEADTAPLHPLVPNASGK